MCSYGGGVDSYEMLLDSIDRGDPPDICAFVDVGNGTATRDSTVPAEWDATYRHIREVIMPLCAYSGIEFVWIDSEHYPVRDADSLFNWMWERHQIPVSGDDRICTIVAKVERFERWLTDRFPDQDVEVWIGFEAGEERRAERDPNAGGRRKASPGDARRRNRFPLIESGLCRCRCVARILARGLALPPGSSCKFCCYNSMTNWQTFARVDPPGFAVTAEMERRKPETASGKKLSIAGYRTLKDAAGNVTGYRAPPLPVYIQGRALGPRRRPCPVCGASERVTKTVGCAYP